MRSIIDGRVYDTATATRVCRIVSASEDPGNFRYEWTFLYKSPRGAYFLAGEGGPLSRWREAVGTGGWSSGSGLCLITEAEARQYAEEARIDPETYEQTFGEVAIG